MLKCCEIFLPTYQDPRGVLTVIESGQDIPFEIKRVFTITEGRGKRGGHCNPGAYVLSAITGSVYVNVEDRLGNQLWQGPLLGSSRGLYTPPDTAVHLSRWSDGAVLLVLSDWHYNEAKV
jgi:hypothetical protein